MNLAYCLRPQTLKEFIGQNHLVGQGKILRQMIETGNLFSMILWGPPGSGKTTLAQIIAKETNSTFHHLSAVDTGKSELMKIIKEAEKRYKSEARNPKSETNTNDQNKNDKNVSNFDIRISNLHQRTILFVDEIHRWNKAQQDALLPYVESGLITLIGATTENPSFEIISALLSRTRVFVLIGLSQQDLEKIINNALTNKDRGVGKYKKTITDDAKEILIRLSGGDARIMLNALEIAVTTSPRHSRERGRHHEVDSTLVVNPEENKTNSFSKITIDQIKEIFQTKSTSLYDQKADEHYNIISAFIKSMRASNPDAALYYLARMIEGGEDPKFIARRMVIFASEDIGMAQPTALVVANEVFRACEIIGYPECAINLTAGTVYLAKAKKDRSAYDAYSRALADVKNYPNEPIPLNLRNAPTKLMKNLGYGKNYEMYSNEDLLPEKLKGRKYYRGK